MAKMAGLRLLAIIGICFFVVVDARPPRADKKVGHGVPEQPETKNSSSGEWDLNIEYNRYLQEVVQILESDADFRKKLEDADVEKIRDGSIAEELDFINHGVRSKLDDIKRQELERLRHLAVKQFEMNEGIDRNQIKIPNHIEFKSPTFEKEDLRKLIAATTKDLEEADRQRRDDFKKYEMEKKFERNERLNHIEDEEKRKVEEQHFQELDSKHKQHERPHHPMTKDQLEEVWEDQDHMRAEDWDPKTFFAMHDLNGDQHWDEDEVRMLFKKELDKVYDPNAPEDDMKERAEEMERMREHVFKESDLNKDKLISYEEFLTETQREEFNNDQGWDTLDGDENGAFTDEEFKAYEMQRQREIQDMLNRGIVPPGYPYYGDIPPGADPFQVPPPHQFGQQQQQPIGIPGQPAYKPDGQQQQGLGHQQFGQAQPQMGHPQMGQPQMGHPQMGQPQMGQPQMGQPQMGQPQMGQPQMGQPQMGQPQMGQPQMGQPQMGQPQVGQPQMGQPKAGQPPVGQPQMGQPQMGQPQMGQPPVGQPQMGQPQMGQPPVGQPQMGQPQMGQPPVGQPQMGQPPIGQPQMGQPVQLNARAAQDGQVPPPRQPDLQQPPVAGQPAGQPRGAGKVGGQPLP